MFDSEPSQLSGAPGQIDIVIELSSYPGRILIGSLPTQTPLYQLETLFESSSASPTLRRNPRDNALTQGWMASACLRPEGPSLLSPYVIGFHHHHMLRLLQAVTKRAHYKALRGLGTRSAIKEYLHLEPWKIDSELASNQS